MKFVRVKDTWVEDTKEDTLAELRTESVLNKIFKYEPNWSIHIDKM
jgi:hypothetical protein